jgi:signal transduction histidine kinase
MNQSSSPTYHTARPYSFSRHQRLYWLVFAATVALTLGNQLIIQNSIREKMYDERIVNLAGRQRMLSQKIVKTAYRALMTRNQGDIIALKNLTHLWDEVHWGLQQGSSRMNLPPVENNNIRELFEQIQPHQTALVEVISNTQRVRDLAPHIEMIDAQAQEFWVIMDRIVGAFEREARYKLTTLMYLELALAGITMLVLVAEIFFVFRPFYRKITAQNEQLRQIAYIQSHEVRRPVCSILGLMQLIQDEEEPAVRAQYIEMLKVSTEELEQATRQIVDRVNKPVLPFVEALLQEAASSKGTASKGAPSGVASSKGAPSGVASSKAASSEGAPSEMPHGPFANQ